MNKEQVFSVAIRVVFLFAFGAFLFASIPHIATFFDNFEQDSGNWFGSYALAISIDATALVLTIGVMFFRKNMPWYAQVFVWFFIIALTAFSWFVNWEYALRFQSDMLTNNDTLKFINPILASSFAFLNLAYSLVSEFFSARVLTAADLEEEAKRLESLISVQNRVNLAKDQLKKPSLIQRAKDVALEVKSAAKEVVTSGDEAAQEEETTEEYEDDTPVDIEPDTDPEIETISPANDAQIVDDIPANITSISTVKKPRITQDLNTDIMPKRGAYAITKEAASELLRCPISEIERGISAGIIKPFAKDMDKVLRTSLEGFVPQKRTRKATKVASK